MLRPQYFGGLRSVSGTCALGAAEDAIGGRHPWFAVWKSHQALWAKCPLCPYKPYEFEAPTVAHLNDHHRLTREQIADFVETLEHEQPPIGVALGADDQHELTSPQT